MRKPEKLPYWIFWNDLRLFLNSILVRAHFLPFSGTFVKKKEKKKKKNLFGMLLFSQWEWILNSLQEKIER